MEAEAPFTRLIDGVSAIDPKLGETTRLLEGSFATGEPRDRELTTLVSTMLLDSVAAGLFSLPTMVEGFRRFAHDFQDRQLDFLRSGAYRAKSYEEVAREVYDNEDFMRTVYYPALLFSYVASPNYRHILRRLDVALDGWKKARVSRLLEVASGHAFLLLFALRALPGASGVGTDISRTAGSFAPELQRITGWGEERFRFAVADVLAGTDEDLEGPFDAAICCELLEHVPNPGAFLRTIHERLRPGGRLFLSAAVRMESVDHLTLFESTEAVANLLREEGFEVTNESSIPFVTRAPRDEAHRARLLSDRRVAATFVAECRRVG